MTKVSLSRQLYSVQRLAKLGRDCLKKQGCTNSEIDMLIADAEAAVNTLRAITPVEEQVRELIRAAKRASH